MKILEVKYQEKEAKIYLDNGEIITMPLFVYYDFQLRIGQTLDTTLYQELLEAKMAQQIKEYINKTLTMRDISSYEICDKVATKFFIKKEKAREYVLPYLTANIIDDARYLKERIYHLILRQYGEYRIYMQLESKGFSKQEIEAQFDEELKAKEEEQASAVAQKYMRLKNKSPDKQKNGLFQKLQYCGYRYELVMRVMKQVGFKINDYSF